MTVTDADRHDLLTALEGTIGRKPAMTLAEHLPPVGWSDVARRSDLDQLEIRLQTSFERKINGLRDELRNELHTEIGSLRMELHTEIGSLRSELHTEIRGVHAEIARSQRLLFFSIVGAFAANTGIMLTVLGLQGG